MEKLLKGKTNLYRRSLISIDDFSGPDDNVFVYFCDHGATGLLKNFLSFYYFKKKQQQTFLCRLSCFSSRYSMYLFSRNVRQITNLFSISNSYMQKN